MAVARHGPRKRLPLLLNHVTFELYSFAAVLGVQSVVIALLAAKAELRYDPRKVAAADIAQAITTLGFPSDVLSDGDGCGQRDLLLHVGLRPYCILETAVLLCL